MSVAPLADDELPRTWPETGLRPHRFAGIFRLLNPDEKQAMDESVSAKGIEQKIVIFCDQILDGRNRYLSLVDMGLFDVAHDWRDHPDMFEEFVGTEQEALDYVWTLNEERRHDSAGERAMAAARRKKLLDELAANSPALTVPTDADLAKEHGVSERLLNSANTIVQHAEPELQRAVSEGRVSVTDAAEATKLDPLEQRIIAENPDRKSAKRAVKAAGKPKQQTLLPDLPSPIGRKELAEFAEEIINLAHNAAYKHRGRGVSISADAILDAARTNGIIERGDDFGFTRSMLLALGKLRDTVPAKPGRRGANDEHPLPPAPPLGQQIEFAIPVLPKGHSASFEVFHEADDSYSQRHGYEWPTMGGSGPFGGSYASYELAIGAAAAGLIGVLHSINARADSLITDSSRIAARNGIAWIEMRLGHWGISQPEPDLFPAAETPAEAYARLVAAQGDQRGKHTQASAEPILRAADEAGDITIAMVSGAIGHPKGTIAVWRNRLGMQKSDRNPSVKQGQAA